LNDDQRQPDAKTKLAEPILRRLGASPSRRPVRAGFSNFPIQTVALTVALLLKRHLALLH
jgi:hypothetical protein